VVKSFAMIAFVAGAMLLAGTSARACGAILLQPDASSEATPKDAPKDQQRSRQDTK
jgi:hypothetical protein